MIDIVFPNGNEEKFLEMAEKLGYESIVFIYPYRHPPHKEYGQKGVLCKTNEIAKAKRAADLVISNDKNVRAVFEAKPDIAYELESDFPTDALHYRNSGLNQTLCRIARGKTSVGFSFASLNEDRALRMGRMMQNIRLCRKFKVNIVIASFAKDPYEMRAPKDLMSYFIVLGMHPAEARDGLNYANEIIKNNKRKREPGYIGEGVEVCK